MIGTVESNKSNISTAVKCQYQTRWVTRQPHTTNIANVPTGENIVTGPLSVKPARNYPLDIYLLMDLSYTMLSNLQNLKTLGTQIGKIFHMGGCKERAEF